MPATSGTVSSRATWSTALTTRGCFCAKAGTVALATPAGARVVHLARDMTVKADHAPYVSETPIAVIAGDSLAVFTGQSIAIDPTAPVRFNGW